MSTKKPTGIDNGAFSLGNAQGRENREIWYLVFAYYTKMPEMINFKKTKGWALGRWLSG